MHFSGRENMSSVKSIQNYQQKPSTKDVASKDYSSRQSFGKGPADNEVAAKIADTFKNSMMSKPVTFLDFLTLKEGEVETQVINNLFTATLAPTMIAFNPFSHKPKKDKEYLAFRQFVSVLVAFGFTLPLTLLVNKQIAKIGSEGDIESIDIRMAQHKDYLHKQFNDRMEAIKNSPKELEKFEEELGITDERITSLKSSKSKFKKIYYEANLEQAFVDRDHTISENLYAELIGNDLFNKKGELNIQKGETAGEYLLLNNSGTPVVKFNEGNKENLSKVTILDESGKAKLLDQKGKVKILNEKVKQTNSDFELIREGIPKINSIEDLKVYVEKRNIYKRKFGDLMSEGLGFELHPNGQIKTESTFKKISNVNIVDFLNVVGLNANLTADDLRKVIGTAYKETKLTEVDKEHKGIFEKLSKLVSRLNQIEKGEANSEKINATLNQVLERTEFLKKFNCDIPAAKFAEKTDINKYKKAFNIPDEKEITKQDLVAIYEQALKEKFEPKTIKKQGIVDKIKEAISANKDEELLFDKLLRCTEEKDIKGLQLQSLMDSPVEKVVTRLKQTFIDSGLKEKFEKEQSIDIAKRYIKTLHAKLTENFKNASKFYSLGAAAVITVFACTILNWAYPRIIEKFFPGLLVKDKPSDVKKGGNE